MRVHHLAVALVLLTACGRKDQPGADAPPQAVLPVSSTWSWHPLGGLAVIEGELSEPAELVLEGRSVKEHRFAEAGPVRWELFRPPAGEEAVLRTADGRELARFSFSAPPPSHAELEARRLAQLRAAPWPERPSAPTEPPDPKVRAEARLQTSTLSALPNRKSQDLPGPTPEPAKPRLQTWFRKLLSLPTPEPPAPTVHAEARLKTTTVPPIPNREPVHLASAATPPADSIRRTAAIPVLPDPSVAPLNELVNPVNAANRAPWPGMGEALNLTRGPGGHKRILLSFDGGSSAEVATEVLDLLKARGVHTTLFLTGAFINRFPALVKRMAAEGHELGNHTMNHPHFAPGMKRDPKWTRARIQKELLDADAALFHLLGRPMDPFWRAPYGEHTAEIRGWAEELGYRHVGWSEGADTLDWATPKDRRLYRSGEAIVQRLEQRLNRNGDGIIVLMHLGSARAAGDRPTDGLGAFMDRAQKEGWTFVSAGTILHDLGKPTWDPHQRLAWLNGSLAQAR